MSFQIGDKVKVISLSKLEELNPKPWKGHPFVSNDDCAFTKDMLEFCGLIGTIINVWTANNGTLRYHLKFDNGRSTTRCWVHDFFETMYVDSFEDV